MARAVRAVTIERGRDPRDFTLVAFGGNGPLFAAEMARSLGIGTVLVPPAPGVFSALGLLEAEVEHHLVRTFLRPLSADDGPPEIDGRAGELEARGRGACCAPRATRGPAEIERVVDLKYQGQSFELTVPLPAGWPARGASGRAGRATSPASTSARTATPPRATPSRS